MNLFLGLWPWWQRKRRRKRRWQRVLGSYVHDIITSFDLDLDFNSDAGVASNCDWRHTMQLGTFIHPLDQESKLISTP